MVAGRRRGPSAWTGFRPFERFGINMLFNVPSGTPFTPTTVYNEVMLANVNSNPSGPLNSRYGPWTSTLDLANLGRPFVTGKPSGTGMGLGVFLTQSIVARLGGSMSYRPRPEGGTCVEVTLPMALLEGG